MAAALLTLTALSIFGLTGSLGLAFAARTSADVARHVQIGVFSTLLNLFAHSLMMFYLLGKGRAVREAVTENNLGGDYVTQIARLRGPVFSRATLAMVLTMATAIIGASVDVQVIPSWPHASLAFGAVAGNLAALFREIVALRGTARIVDEVNSRIV